MIPPALITLRIGWVWLPLPVVVLWPLLILLVLAATLLLPMVPVNGTTPGQRARWPMLAWQALASTPGLAVSVREASGRSVSVLSY